MISNSIEANKIRSENLKNLIEKNNKKQKDEYTQNSKATNVVFLLKKMSGT